MQVHKPIVLLLPSRLRQDLDKHLSSESVPFSFKLEYFYYLIHFIIKRHSECKNDEFIYLDMKKLRAFTVSNIDRYLTILRKGKFLLCDGQYRNGRKALEYKINDIYLNDELTRVEILPNTKLFKRIRKNINKAKSNYCRLPKHLQVMQKHLRNLEFDYQGAKEWISKHGEPNKKPFYYLAVEQLQDKRMRYFKRNKTNKRLDTNLTNLKKELRQFIKGDLVAIDLKNSQPFLLNVLLTSIINEGYTIGLYLDRVYLVKTYGIKRLRKVSIIRKNQEISKNTIYSFADAVTNGNFYESFIQQYENDISRDEVKDITIKVLFSNNSKDGFTPYRKEKAKFESVYPMVYRQVSALKEGNNKTLPIHLQKIESYLFIDCIAKELVSKNIIPLTVHDSVIVKATEAEETLQIIQSIFNREIGIVPSFHIEPLKQIA